MSALDNIKAGIRTVLNSENLGETLTYEVQKTKLGDRGKAYEASATLTGFFLEQTSQLQFESGDVDVRTCQVRTADTATELAIGDRFVKDSINWIITGKQRQPGMFVYECEGHTRHSAGPEER